MLEIRRWQCVCRWLGRDWGDGYLVSFASDPRTRVDPPVLGLLQVVQMSVRQFGAICLRQLPSAVPSIINGITSPPHICCLSFLFFLSFSLASRASTAPGHQGGNMFCLRTEAGSGATRRCFSVCFYVWFPVFCGLARKFVCAPVHPPLLANNIS